MAAARGKTIAILVALLGMGGITGSLVLSRDRIVAYWREWKREKRLSEETRWTLEQTVSLNFENGRPALPHFLRVLHLLGTKATVRFEVIGGAARKAEIKTLHVDVEPGTGTIEGMLRRGLASTGRRFRYWIKGDAVMIDLDG